VDFLKRIDCYKMSYVSLDEEKDKYTAAKVNLKLQSVAFLGSKMIQNTLRKYITG